MGCSPLDFVMWRDPGEGRRPVCSRWEFADFDDNAKREAAREAANAARPGFARSPHFQSPLKGVQSPAVFSRQGWQGRGGGGGGGWRGGRAGFAPAPPPAQPAAGANFVPSPSRLVSLFSGDQGRLQKRNFRIDPARFADKPCNILLSKR